MNKNVSPQEMADLLAYIVESNKDEEAVKSALDGLYTLKQAGFSPSKPIKTAVPRVSKAAKEAIRAYASMFDGAGNRLLLFAIPDPDGGHPNLLEVLINDLDGVTHYDALRMPSKELETRLTVVFDQLKDGLAVTEVPLDYARWLVAQSRALTRTRMKTTPTGFIDWADRIGEPQNSYPTSPVYDLISRDDLQESRPDEIDVDAFFEYPWFSPWFFAAEDVASWLQMRDRFQAMLGNQPEEPIYPQALAMLMPEAVRSAYIGRLEESAFVLERREEHQAARLALFMAMELAEAETVSDSVFARALLDRSLAATEEMIAAQQASAAS